MEKEKSIKNERKKSYHIKEVSVICPIHFCDWNFFPSNLQSWFDELPIKKLYIGCNNKDKKFYETLQDYLSGNNKIEFIDQRGIKTLGKQIADLMKRVNTEFFVYCHADAMPTKHSFLVLEAEMEDDVGIVESERVQYDYDNPPKYPTVYPYYHYRERSFSGYQLFRTSILSNILLQIEDDFIYRNEDIIFQNVCLNEGFKYVKSFAMHIHTCSNVNHRWTPQGVEIEVNKAHALMYDMQIKGIIKYCVPDKISIKAWKDAIGPSIQLNKTDLFDFLNNFVKKTNPIWEKAIKNVIKKLLQNIYH